MVGLFLRCAATVLAVLFTILYPNLATIALNRIAVVIANALGPVVGSLLTFLIVALGFMFILRPLLPKKKKKGENAH